MASDVRVWDGTKWESLKGPKGDPTTISAAGTQGVTTSVTGPAATPTINVGLGDITPSSVSAANAVSANSGGIAMSAAASVGTIAVKGTNNWAAIVIDAGPNKTITLGANVFPAVDRGTNGQVLTTNGSGTLSWQTPASTYTLPVATATVLGGVKQGSNVTIAADGTISVAAAPAASTIPPQPLGVVANTGNSAMYARADHVHLLPTYAELGPLPRASIGNPGAVVAGDGLIISGDGTGTLSVDRASISGISQTAADARYVNITGDTMTGNLSLSQAGDSAVGVTTTGGNIAALQLTNQAAGGRAYRIAAWGALGAGALAIDDTTANVRRFTIDADGDVGIGTASPTSTLHISGSGARSRLTDTGITNASFNTLSIFAADQNRFGIGVGSSTATTSHIVIDGTTGNVGFGTASPAARLDVVGTGVQIQASNGTVLQRVGYCAFDAAYSGSATAHPYALLVGDVERMRIDTSGNVGIGTANPGSLLEVIQDGGQGINCLNNGGAGTTNYAVMAQAAGNATANTGLYVNCLNAASNYGVRIVNPPAGPDNWAIFSDATARSYFGGSIGIGTFPSQMLDVNGTALIRGNATFQGTTNTFPARSINNNAVAFATPKQINVAAYTVAAADAGTILWNVHTAADAFINLPTDAEAAIPVGAIIRIMADTTRLTYIRPNAGASLFWQASSSGSFPDNSTRQGGSGPTFATRPLGRLSLTQVVKVAANTWYHFPN